MGYFYSFPNFRFPIFLIFGWLRWVSGWIVGSKGGGLTLREDNVCETFEIVDVTSSLQLRRWRLRPLSSPSPSDNNGSRLSSEDGDDAMLRNAGHRPELELNLLNIVARRQSVITQSRSHPSDVATVGALTDIWWENT